ncbi:LOW QUALITY PROTEIN: thioredoxin, mitochondrial-like [Uloborus diversus]|uniref:LOW QUALITY PROTEIN: thioredoxin, mitochondrial-like n=1 Tax=Uloborus diversus TaxID=327109 RepID=UPI002409FDBD|nr:LOW QUALITY PROTEIN: thioredoxin, mitochondrial-like [Uloborus diversus]
MAGVTRLGFYNLYLNQTARNVFSSTGCHVRMITSSAHKRKIFKIQDETDFEERVVKSDVPVVIDFQASWCGPCKILEPRLETVIGTKNEKVHLAKVDIDANAEIAMKYDVQAVPHVVGFKNGKTQKSFTGVKDEDQLESFVNQLIDA